MKYSYYGSPKDMHPIDDMVSPIAVSHVTLHAVFSVVLVSVWFTQALSALKCKLLGDKNLISYPGDYQSFYGFLKLIQYQPQESMTLTTAQKAISRITTDTSTGKATNGVVTHCIGVTWMRQTFINIWKMEEELLSAKTSTISVYWPSQESRSSFNT